MSDGTKLGEDIRVRSRHETREPSLYRVILLNDDYTTMEFVIHVLETIFSKPAAEAVQIMLSVHKKGSGICGVYTREIAETKLSAVHGTARKNGYPLKCIMEKE
ncbi:MAG TPA: ATP-dependent Clp protease adapter ClpS [Dissulfurispiraceae bacterium]|nr:ATP-dependent Clp protease adapter ClpS [Dissulfurispiraceae bacterium]